MSATAPWTAASCVPAGLDDLEPIRQLLATLRLPAADVGRPDQSFLVSREGSGIVGCVGLEVCGPDALLRSLAVVPGLQGQGLGKALYEAVVEQARRQGVGTLYLLTTTAEAFFARAGFTRIARAEVPPAVAATEEFRSLCPATAACMVRRLR